MPPNLQLKDELTSQTRAILADTPLVRFAVGPSTLEKPLGTVFALPIGLVAYSSNLLRTYFGAPNRDPDTGSLAAACNIYLLPDAKPEHFAVLVDYMLHGHGMLKSSLGKSILATAKAKEHERLCTVGDIDVDNSKATEYGRRNERIYKILAGSLADDAVQHLMPKALMFLDAAQEVNAFISLCNKLSMNRAIWTAIVSYDLIVSFAILHNIPLSPTSSEMMPWGPLGDVLTIKNKEVRMMMPKEVFALCRGVVGTAYRRHVLMKGIVDGEAKLYLELDSSEWDSADKVDHVEMTMK